VSRGPPLPSPWRRGGRHTFLSGNRRRHLLWRPITRPIIVANTSMYERSFAHRGGGLNIVGTRRHRRCGGFCAVSRPATSHRHRHRHRHRRSARSRSRQILPTRRPGRARHAPPFCRSRRGLTRHALERCGCMRRERERERERESLKGNGYS